MVIVASWRIAFFEYCLQVPANRIGHYEFTATQLKTIQEVITLVVFCIFSVLYLKEPLKQSYLASFGLMVGAVFGMVRGSWWPILYCAHAPSTAHNLTVRLFLCAGCASKKNGHQLSWGWI